MLMSDILWLQFAWSFSQFSGELEHNITTHYTHRVSNTILIMCPPLPTKLPGGSTGSMINPMFFFDTKRKVLQQDHKLTTGDLSQVCDGRNWETFRDVANKTKSRTTAKKENIATDKTKASAGATDCADADTKSITMACYMPVSSRKENQEQYPPTMDHQDDKEPQCINLTPPREASSEAATAQEQGNPQEQDNPSLKPTSSTASNDRRRSSSHSSRHHSNENKDKVRGSRRRRHSVEDNSRPSIPEGKPSSRRLSIDSNTTTSSSMTSGARTTVRKLSEPMHRCTTTNQNVLGIMRRSRYSSNDLAFMAKTSSEGAGANQRHRRRASISPYPGKTLDHGLSLGFPRSVSADSLVPLGGSSSNIGMKRNESMEDLSDPDWVASGVNFAKSMEVWF